MGGQVAEGGMVGVEPHLVSKGERIIIQKGGRANGCGRILRICRGGDGLGERDLLRMQRCRPDWPWSGIPGGIALALEGSGEGGEGGR